MKLAFKKGLTVSSLCCIQIYLAVQIVGQTEASYSSVKSVEPIAISTAFVFPKTINELEIAAVQLSNKMQGMYNSIPSFTLSDSIEELSEQLSKISEMEKALNKELSTLLSIRSELDSYQNRVNDQQDKNERHTYQYVTKGFLHVESIIKKIRTTIDFEKLNALKAAIISKLNDLKEEKLMQNTPSAKQTEHPQEIQSTSGPDQAEVILSPSHSPNNNK